MTAQRHGPGDQGIGAPAMLPPWSTPFHPLVDFVAAIRASVHAKLLSGFLIGALLMLGMAILSLVVIDRMVQRVDEITALQDNVDRARRMEYLITAQSHFRAMALLTQRDFYNDDIALAKMEFLEHLDAVERGSPADKREFFQQVRDENDRFAASSAWVLELYQADKIEEALEVHISEEHEESHVIEDAMRELQADVISQMNNSRAQFGSDTRLITAIVWTFSGVSLATALLLGIVTSWAFLRPVRAIDNALARIAHGDFQQKVEVPNRDEFGTLSHNLNIMGQQLGNLYEELSNLNETLQQRLDELQRAHQQLQEYASQAEAFAAVQERNRLARELHDSVTQTIFSMTLTTEAARILLQRDPAQAAPYLDRLQELAQNALNAMRSLIQQFRTSPAAEEGLVTAIQSLLDTLESTQGLKVDFQVAGDGRISRQTEGELFRIVQEALNNVSRHSQTDRALVRLHLEDGQSVLSIEDHGVGFDLSRVGAHSQGFGLTSIRERVEMLGGVLEIKSAPGEGTQVLVRLSQPPGGADHGRS